MARRMHLLSMRCGDFTVGEGPPALDADDSLEGEASPAGALKTLALCCSVPTLWTEDDTGWALAV